MGYETYVTGSLKITPKLPQSVIEDLHMDENGEADVVCANHGDEDTVELINGQITVVPGNSWTTVTPRWDHPFKAYTLGEELLSLEKAAKKNGSTITGALYCDGEESQDLKRWFPGPNGMVLEEPELVWPNGDKGWGA